MLKRLTALLLACVALICARTPSHAYGKDIEEKIKNQGLTSAGVFLRVYHKGSTEKIFGLFFALRLADWQSALTLARAGLTRSQIEQIGTAARANGEKGVVKAFNEMKLDPEDVLRALCITIVHDYGVREAIGLVMSREGLTEDLLSEALDLPYGGWEMGSAPQGEITGRLENLDGVEVIRLWGTARQRGYAYGKLLAKSIMAFVNRHMLTEAMDGVLGDVPWDAICDSQYMRYDFDGPYLEEIKGMLLAINEELSEKERIIAKYKRPLKLADLLCLNSSGDWAGVFGSALCTRAGDSNLAGRNLDIRYDDGNELFKRPFWLVIEPDKKTEKGLQPYATLTWPGFICGHVGFAQNGAWAMVQDGDGESLDKIHCQPRALLLRRALQKSSSGQRFCEEAAAALEKQNVTRGAIVLAGGKKARPPYMAAEIDGNHDDSKGVECRTISPDAGKATLTAANTFELRYREEREAYWKTQLEKNPEFRVPEHVTESRERLKKLNEASRNKEITDVETLFAVLAKVAFKGEGRFTTVAAFAIDADKGVVHFKISKNRTKTAHAETTMKFELEKLFAR